MVHVKRKKQRRKMRPDGLSFRDSFYWYMNSPQPTDGSCWDWGGYFTGEGLYGCFSWNNHHWIASRASYVIHVGDIPDGMVVKHSCDRPSCVNPQHLSIGTPQSNTAEMADRERSAWHRSEPGSWWNPSGLTEHSVTDIRRRFDLGESRTVIGRDHNVSPEVVRRIGKRLSWKHIQENLSQN